MSLVTLHPLLGYIHGSCTENLLPQEHRGKNGGTGPFLDPLDQGGETANPIMI